MAIDEVVESKSGKQTSGLGRFFSSIVGRVIPSVCFHVLSLIEIESQKSFVLTQEQRINTAKGSNKSNKSNKKYSKSTSKGKASSAKAENSVKRRGRPKGSKNKTNKKAHTGLSLSFERLLTIGLSLLSAVGIIPNYIVADGAYSSKTYVLICLEQGVHLVSKLRHNSALYLPFEGKYKGRGRKRKYGKKIDYKTLNPKHSYYYKTIVESSSPIQIEVYHFPKIWVKFLPVQINVVVLIAINTVTGKRGRRVLFTTDLKLNADKLIQYYTLRFQIEFNFRDAKQYFGLADFRAYKPTQVKNSVGLAFFMVNLSHIIRKKMIELWQVEFLSILDLKAGFRAEVQLQRVFKLLDLDLEQLKSQVNIKDFAAKEAINLT